MGVCVCVWVGVGGCVHPSASFLGHKEDGNDVSMRMLGYGDIGNIVLRCCILEMIRYQLSLTWINLQ